MNAVVTAVICLGAAAQAIEIKPRWTGGMTTRAISHGQALDVLGRAVEIAAIPEKRYIAPLFIRQANGTATNGTAPALELPNQGGQTPQQGQNGQEQDQEGQRREQEENQRQQEAAQRQRMHGGTL